MTTPIRQPKTRLATVGPLRVTVLGVALVVAGVVLTSLGQLAYWTWQKYGAGIPTFYWGEVFGNTAMISVLRDTAIAVVFGCILATLLGAVLAWINERTTASLGAVGSLLPLVPFFMPAIALPLGWVFLAAPRAGALNVALRSVLNDVGVTLESGPIDIYSWYGLVFLYAIWLAGFSYTVLSSAMQSIDPQIEEAARLSGAGPLRILFRIVLPALRPALINAFLLSLIPGVALVSVPIVIGGPANIDILSVRIVRLITDRQPAEYEQAFLLGLLLLMPILLVWLLQRRSTSGGNFSLIGGRSGRRVAFDLAPHSRRIARTLFVLYGVVAVALPLLGLLYVSGTTFWSSGMPTEWNPVPNIVDALRDDGIRTAIQWSLVLGLAAGLALVVGSHLLAFVQRLYPRLGKALDALAKLPAGVSNILVAIGLLVGFGGAPFYLGGTLWILLLGYYVVYMPYSSVMIGGAQQRIGEDMIEAARVSGASDGRTLLSVVTPLSRSSLVAGFLLMFVFASGDLNLSLILASSRRPVIGLRMVELFQFASFPRVAAFALIVTLVVLCCVAVMWTLLHRRGARD